VTTVNDLSTAVDCDVDVQEARARIDALDDELIRLVRQRAELSRQIQQARIAQGDSRIAAAREGEVLDRWHAALDRPGVSVARALLELSRGTRPLAS
jgi:chorismate mutase